MTRRLPRGCAAAWLLCGAVTALAQDKVATKGDPLDAHARVPAVTYQSPLDGYRRLTEDKPLSWKGANEAVSRIGGWRAYAREAQQPDAAPSAPATRGAPVPASSTAPAHGGHKMH